MKQPSFVKQVNYAKLVEELWKTKVSDDKEVDSTVKKTVANTNFGMLEKGINKKQRSFIFSTYEECKYYQAQYGGEISVIRQYEEKTTSYNSPLDAGIKDPDIFWSVECVQTGGVLYILNISASASLTNGFRYIKELLMQHHNYYMNECHETLLKNGIQVATVKTDALTISEGDLEKAKQLLNFEAGIGNWRVSKREDIKFPHLKLEMKENTAIAVEELEFNNIELTLKQEYDVDTPMRAVRATQEDDDKGGVRGKRQELLLRAHDQDGSQGLIRMSDERSL